MNIIICIVVDAPTCYHCSGSFSCGDWGRVCSCRAHTLMAEMVCFFATVPILRGQGSKCTPKSGGEHQSC